MDLLYKKMSFDFWPRMLQYTTYMEDVCSFAQVSKYFYRLTKTDFQQLCYRNIIYRLDGKTWATAFANTPSRRLDETIDTIPHVRLLEQSICCPHTGTIAVLLEKNHVLLTNIDFAKKVFELLDFQHLTGNITNVQLINKSTKLIIGTTDSCVVFDLINKTTVKVYPVSCYDVYDGSTLHHYKNGILVDLYNQKEYKVEPSRMVGLPTIKSVDSYGYSKHIGYMDVIGNFVVINNKTGKKQTLDINNWDYGDKISILDNVDQLIVNGTDYFKIYDDERCSFVKKRLNGTNWSTSPYVTLIGLKYFQTDIFFLRRNQKTQGMDIVKQMLSSQILTNGFFVDTLPFVTTYYLSGKCGRKTLVHLDWSTGKLVSKKFYWPDFGMKRFNFLKFCSIPVNGTSIVGTEFGVRMQFEQIIDQ
ncbi:unnamed protein product [Bursaphelenchus okinawaensis]|uniref:Uncharacterized protein n=1 Tax=Bursaphelenchus okinawaensis TaxID=465554 RepID=A0A811LIX6_9BILA|nr:unnamed protein product [Bursaphelenchus okinawaensis]CAG9124100.1 unnamed protein product [Bursaphelenchus okinawaensis]